MFLRLISGREDKQAITSKGNIYKKIFGDIYLSTAQIVVFSLATFAFYSLFKGISVYGLIIAYATISIYVAVFFFREFFKIKSKVRNKDFDEVYFLNSVKRKEPFSDSDAIRAISLIDRLLAILIFLFILNVFLLYLAIHDIGELCWVISFAGVLISLLILSMYHTYSNLFVDKR
ncbi:hypothetical protein [Mannheimia indoligenes]|uniref:hypothetical protein n=1 Tax=Mannheimia indoligenes TaxID=3103145 RepID=UPI002FE62A62